VTELVTVTSARLQPDGWEDWVRWARAGAAHHPDPAQSRPVIDMLEADGGEFLSFALVTARTH
jgi:hypothetical protein